MLFSKWQDGCLPAGIVRGRDVGANDLTLLGGEDGSDGTEGALAFGVVGAHFHAERAERGDAVVAADVARHAGCGGDGVGPGHLTQGPEGDDVAEAVTVLQFLRHRLRGKHTTIVILKHIWHSLRVQPTITHSLRVHTSSICSKYGPAYELTLLCKYSDIKTSAVSLTRY